MLGLRSDRKRLAIIGSGASGTLLAVRAGLEMRKTDIYLIERSGIFGPGLAYGVSDPCFLLNVPADKVGAFHEAPSHFFEWMANHPERWRGLHADFYSASYKGNDFVPRMIYGAYLKDLLYQAEKQAENHKNDIVFLTSEVESVLPISGKNYPLQVTFKDHTPIYFDAVIFATGNSNARYPLEESGIGFPDTYKSDIFEELVESNETILILGTGLSMVDLTHALEVKGFKGNIVAISRHGLLPLSHTNKTTALPPLFDSSNRLDTALEIIKSVRKEIKDAISKGISWQSVINALRPVSESLWFNLSEKEQRRLNRIMPWWNIARHRIPECIHTELNTLIDNKKLKIIKSRIIKASNNAGDYKVMLANGEEIKGSKIFNCTGFDYSAEYIENICPDIAISKHWSGSVAIAEYKHYRLSREHPVYGIGPILCRTYFESTAIHDIRLQAKVILQEI